MNMVAEINNPFDLLWALCLWAFWLLAAFGVAILVFAVILGMVRGVRGWFGKYRYTKMQMIRMAETNAVMRYRNYDDAHARVDSFVEGARWVVNRDK